MTRVIITLRLVVQIYHASGCAKRARLLVLSAIGMVSASGEKKDIFMIGYDSKDVKTVLRAAFGTSCTLGRCSRKELLQMQHGKHAKWCVTCVHVVVWLDRSHADGLFALSLVCVCNDVCAVNQALGRFCATGRLEGPCV